MSRKSMFCSNCGTLMPSNSHFCSNCGQKAPSINDDSPPPIKSKKISRLLICTFLLAVILIGFSFLSKGSSDSKKQMAISYRDVALPLMLETGALSTTVQNTMLGFGNGGVYQHEAITILRSAQPQCANILSQVEKIRAGYSELKETHQYFIKGVKLFCQGINQFKRGMEFTNPQELRNGSATILMATQEMKIYGEEINRLQLDLNSE